MKKKTQVTHIKRNLPPTILTIFGATGHLTANYLLPALFRMYCLGMLPEDFRLICVGRKPLSRDEYLDFILKKSKKFKSDFTSQERRGFLETIEYFQGDFENPESFKPLAEMISDREIKGKHSCYNRLYYFATTPNLFARIAQILKSSGLLQSCVGHGRQTRVLVEKPFGENLASAQALNFLLKKFFNEEQIYRIDHYQGKETVQNIIITRFANGIFEPLWNKDYIDFIEINVFYKDKVKERINFYNQVGALKDIVQNHALMMLSLILMDEPSELTVENLRNEKSKILKALRLYKKTDVEKNVVLGQYDSYEQELKAKSRTETYVALRAFVDSPRWQNVPIYIKTGKALKQQVTEISIHFKELPKCLFKGCAANVLTFRIQPNESVQLTINNKIPGFGIELHQANLDFTYQKAYEGQMPTAYERLLLDFMEGDQRLFMRSDEIEASWKFIDSITANWQDLPVNKYKKGSKGPEGVFNLTI